MITTKTQWTDALGGVADAGKVPVLSRFFKTGKGEYGEGDEFIGVKVPDNRAVAKKAAAAPLPVVEEMLSDPIHERRLSALLSLVERYRKSKSAQEKRTIVEFYLSHTAWINNWDLVDLSAPYLVGAWMLESGDEALAEKLSVSSNMWEQRIAVVSTMTLIRAGRFELALGIVERLLPHPHDLIRKANGWMLREIGKKDESALLAFLELHAARMPRTTLRYAVERLPEELRRRYMRQGK